MPVVRVTERTMERLKAHARPFEDTTPDDVINRGLDALDQSLGNAKTSPPSASNSVHNSNSVHKLKAKALTKSDMREPLIELMKELGGSQQVGNIRAKLEIKLSHLLSVVDYEPVSSNEPRWWNRVCWLRQDLVDEGIFKAGSPRGVWELAE